jgi:hypothetical protein
MFVEPQRGSGLDKVAPAYLVRRLLSWVGKRDSGGKAQPPAQQQNEATRSRAASTTGHNPVA